MDLKEFRKKNPAYNDWSDQELANGLHQKYYSDMPFDSFASQIGYTPPAKEETPVAEEPVRGIAAAVPEVEGATPEATKRRTGIADVLYNTIMSPIGLLGGVDVNAPEIKQDSPFFSALGKSVTRFKQSNTLNELAELENLRNIVDKKGALDTRPGTREEQLARIDTQIKDKQRDLAEYGMETKAIEEKFGKNKFAQKYDDLTESDAYKEASLPKQMAMTGELYIKDLPGLVSYARDIGAENFLSAVPTIVSAVAARFAGFGAPGAAVAGGYTSAMNEFGNQYAELRAQGKSHEDAWIEAGVKSSVIGLFDAASFKSAGNALDKIVSNSMKQAPLKATAKEVGKETLKQAGFGASGEALGSVAINQPVNLRNVLEEALGETVGAPAEAITTYGQKKNAPLTPIGATTTTTEQAKPKFEIDPATGILREVKAPEIVEQATQAAPLTKQGELFTKEEAPYQVTSGDVSVEAQARQEQSDRAQEQIAALTQQLAQTTDPQQAAVIRDDISKLQLLVEETGQQKAIRLGDEMVTLYRKGTALSQQKTALEAERDAEKTLDGKKVITDQIKAIDAQLEQVIARQEEIEVEGKKLEKEGVTFDKTRDDLDLKGPSPIVNKKVLAKFGLAPKAPIRQELLNLDMTDPEDRQKFIDAVDRHTIKKAKINMDAVEAYLSAFETPVQEEAQVEPSIRESGAGTSEPSIPVSYRGTPGAPIESQAFATPGLAGAIPTIGRPFTGAGAAPETRQGALVPQNVPETVQGALVAQGRPQVTISEDASILDGAVQVSETQPTMVNTPNRALEDKTDPASEWDKIAQGNVLPAYSNLPEAAKAEWAASDRDVIAAQNIFEKYIRQIDAISDAQKRLQNVDIHNELSTNEKQVIAEHYGEDSYNDVVKSKFVQDVITALTQGLDKVAAVLRNIIKRLQAGALAAVIAINTSAMSPPIHFAIPAMDTKTEVVMAQVPVQAASKMSEGAKRAYGVLYPAMKQYLQENNKLFIMTDKPSARMFIFNPDGSLLLERKVLLGRAFGDFYKGNTDIRANRITPAGLFTMSIRQNNATSNDYDFQTVLGLEQIEDGSKYFVTTMHSVWMHERDNQERMAALQTEGTADARMSFGCINIDKPTFAYLFENHLGQIDGAKTFIVPDNPADTMSFINGEAVKSKDMVRDKADIVTKTVKTPKAEVKKAETERPVGTRREDFVTAAPVSGRETAVGTGPSQEAVAKVERTGTVTGETTDAMQKAAAEGNLRIVLEEIAKNASGKFNALEQLVARRLMSVPGLLPRIEVVDPSVLVDENGKQASGQYVPRTDTIQIARGEVDSHTVLHETVHGYLHALIVGFLAGEFSNKGLTDLQAIFETLKKEHPGLLTDPRTKYGMQSLTEFASEMMSNRVFQDVLNTIEYRSSNAFTEFARSVLKILNISPSKNFTALAAALIAADRSLSTGRQYQETRVTDKTAMGAVPVQRSPEAEKAAKDSEGFANSAGPAPKAGFFRRTADKMRQIREGNINAGSMFGNLQNFAANNQAFLNRLRKASLELEEAGSITHEQAELAYLGMIGAQISQRGQLSVQMMDNGKWKYDPQTNTYDPIHDKDNMNVFGDLATKLAERLGIDPEVALTYIDQALEANRLQSVDDKLIKAKAELTRTETRIKTLENDVKRQRPPKGTKTAVEQRRFDKAEDARVEKARDELKLKKELAKELRDDIETYTDQMMHKDRNNIRSGMDLYNDHPEIQEATRVWNVMRQRVVDLMVETGLLTEEKAQRWLDEAAYVPFFRDVESTTEEAQQVMVKGLRETMAPLRAKYKGSMLEVSSVSTNMRQWMQWAIAGSISNRQIKRMLDQYRAYIPDGIREGRDPNRGNFTVMENGVERVYNVDDPDVAQAFIQQGAYVFSMLKIAKGASDIARKNVTRNPMFSLAQIPSDLYAAMFTSGIKNPGALVVKLLTEAVKTSVGMSQTRKDLIRRGLINTHEYNAQLTEDSIKYAQDIVPPSNYRKVMHIMDKFGAFSDNVVRQAVYNQLISEGASPQKAETAVVEIMNFRNKSGIKGLNTASATVVFFNSWLQSLALILKTLSGKGITYQTRADGWKTLGIVSAKVAAFSFLLAALSDMGDDEDEYAKRSRTGKNSIFGIPGTDGMGLAVREDMYALPHILAQYTYRYMFREADKRGVDTKSLKDSFFRLAKNTLVPPAEGVPQVVKPTLEGITGTDFHTGQPIVPPHMKDMEPFMQFNANTAEYAKWLGNATNMSPLQIEHFIKGYFGTTAQLFDMVFGGLIAEGRGIPKPAETVREKLGKLPSIGKSFGKEENQAVAEDLYEVKKDFDRALNTYKKLNETDNKAAEEYRKEHGDMMHNAAGTVKELENIKRRENYVRNLPSKEKNPEKGMTAEEKAAELQLLKERKQRLEPLVRNLRKIADY